MEHDRGVAGPAPHLQRSRRAAGRRAPGVAGWTGATLRERVTRPCRGVRAARRARGLSPPAGGPGRAHRCAFGVRGGREPGLAPRAVAGGGHRRPPVGGGAPAVGVPLRPRLGRNLRRLRPAELPMARGLRLRLWLAAAPAACVVVALAYLPPRGGVRAPEPLRLQIPQPTPARLRAQQLADAWRAVEAEVRLRESRYHVASDLNRGDSAEGGPLLLAAGADSVVSVVRPVLRAELDTAWRRLGLGSTKVNVVGRVSLPTTVLRTSGAETPAEALAGGASYLLPDSTDRTTCGVFLPAGYLLLTLVRTGRLERLEQFRESLKNSLGPCAFYAAYGNPGKPVRHWLANRNFDVALSPSWNAPGNLAQSTWWLTDYRTGHWWWEMIYRRPPSTVACLGGRPAGCRDAVLQGVGYGFDDSLPRVLAPERRWWLRQGLGPGGC